MDRTEQNTPRNNHHTGNSVGEGSTLIEMEQSRKNARDRRKQLQTELEDEMKQLVQKIPPTDDDLRLFREKLLDARWKELKEVVDKMLTWDVVMTISEEKSFLYYTRLSVIMAHMLADIDKYRQYLEQFILRFEAENELILNSSSGRSDGPIHFAAQQLHEGFLEWLLSQPSTDVNLRNNQQETALAILCEKYDQMLRPAKAPNATDVTSDVARIQRLIEQLLEAGADFNILSRKLPIELLLRHSATAGDDVKAFVQRCIRQAGCALAVGQTVDKGRRRVGFINNDPNVRLTEELLEIFLRFGDDDQFKQYWSRFVVADHNVKKVIRLVLHSTLDQKLPECLRLVVDKGDKLIFQYSSPQQKKKCRTEICSSVLKHRVELKGLLRKACEMGDLSVLQLLVKRITDLVLLNDDPLLAVTLNKAHKTKRASEEREALLACAEFLAITQTIFMSKTDDSGNTPLHLALKYGFDSVALSLLKQRYAYLGLRNRDNLTPLDYGPYEFWKRYLDQCIEVEVDRSNDRRMVRFNLNCLEPFTPVKGALAAAHRRRPTNWKFLQDATYANHQPRRYERTVTEMTTVRQIAQSKELKTLLIHPVVHTFIMVKWMRLSHWNYLNLLLTVLTTGFFGGFSLTACSRDGPSWLLQWLSVCGAVLVTVREILQMLFLRKSYLSFENLLDIGNVVAMGVVLWRGCNGLLSSLVLISLAIQVTFLLGSLPFNSLSTMMYMFKTVSKNFLKSFLLFIPLIGTFVYAFYLTYNESPAEVDARDACADDDCAEQNYNSFHTFWIASIKTLVMTTGELEAATFDFANGKVLLFILFLFIAPIVIMNLINGLAVSDIAAIREESELISITKKVMLLEQYERGVANVQLPWLGKLFPRPFFADHNCWIQVHAKEFRKIEVHPKEPEAPTKAKPMGKQRRQDGGKFVPISVFPWLGNGCSNLLLNFRICKVALFMRLDQSILNEALAISEKRYALTKNALQSQASIIPETPPAITNRVIHTPSPTIAPRLLRRAESSVDDPNARLHKEIQELKKQMATLLELARGKPSRTKQRNKGKGLQRKARKRARLVLKRTLADYNVGDQ